MLSSISTVETPNASRYIRMLCKHFAHKIPATYNEWRGECEFACGTAVMIGSVDALNIELRSPTEDELNMTKHVIEDHLIRFAQKEGVQSLEWRNVNS